eukprot:TRINITY_DN18083_c0_g1_i1.p1 TRINITY_DN18083_c0_g1~~TRINITY_DN18083_c0_g1_i1.p1  ORF type:complete len:204 (+),score=51.37 TRINITY_DN18083_c0_g1_i1:62-673(+)
MVLNSRVPQLSGLKYIKGESINNITAFGKPIVLEFWATWCGPCRQSVPHLTNIQKRFGDKMAIIGITSETEDKAGPFVTQMGAKMDYRVALDTMGSAQQLMEQAGARGIPHAFIVDHTGTIKYSGHPMQPDFMQTLEQAVRDAEPKEPLPLIMSTRDELKAMSIKELKTILKDRKVSMAGLVEKDDLVDKVVEACSTTIYYKS